MDETTKETVERLRGLADLEEKQASRYLGKTGHEALLSASLQAGAEFYRQAADLITRLSERVGELETDRDFGRTVSGGLLEQLNSASRMSSPITLDHSAAADVWGEVVHSRSELFHLRRALLSKQEEPKS